LIPFERAKAGTLESVTAWKGNIGED